MELTAMMFSETSTGGTGCLNWARPSSVGVPGEQSPGSTRPPPVSGLSADDIWVLGAGNSEERGFALPGTLSGSGTSWQLVVSDVQMGKVSITIRSFGVDHNPRITDVYSPLINQGPPPFQYMGMDGLHTRWCPIK